MLVDKLADLIGERFQKL